MAKVWVGVLGMNFWCVLVKFHAWVDKQRTAIVTSGHGESVTVMVSTWALG